MLNVERTSIWALLCSWLFCSTALADQINSNQPTDTRICADTSYQVSHLPKNTSRLDWPKDLKFQGLSWPEWSGIDPSEHLDVIEKAVQWPNARGNNLSRSLSDYYKAYGTDQQKESIWKNLGKPYYLQMIRSNRLIMQTTKIIFSAGSNVPSNLVQGNFIRFRTLPTVEELRNISISSLHPEYDDYGWYDLTWHYVILSLSNFPTVNDIPISLRSLPLGGELGLVGNELKLFETPGMPAQIDDIFISRRSGEHDQYTVLSVFGICGRQ